MSLSDVDEDEGNGHIGSDEDEDNGHIGNDDKAVDEGNDHIVNDDEGIDKADGGMAMMTMDLTKAMVT